MAITAFREENQSRSPLEQKIADHISTAGPIPFREFMEFALYDDEYGYYAGPRQRVGKQGDFITSVSVGRCFGMMLAHRLEKYWQEIGQPNHFEIIELGAHDGTLCNDILTEISHSLPEFYQAVTYRLVETTDILRQAQKEKLSSEHHGKFQIHSHIEAISDATGAVLSNELIDALPVDLIRWQAGDWHLLMVNLDDEGHFHFQPHPVSKDDELSLIHI